MDTLKENEIQPSAVSEEHRSHLAQLTKEPSPVRMHHSNPSGQVQSQPDSSNNGTLDLNETPDLSLMMNSSAMEELVSQLTSSPIISGSEQQTPLSPTTFFRTVGLYSEQPIPNESESDTGQLQSNQEPESPLQMHGPAISHTQLEGQPVQHPPTSPTALVDEDRCPGVKQPASVEQNSAAVVIDHEGQLVHQPPTSPPALVDEDRCPGVEQPATLEPNSAATVTLTTEALDDGMRNAPRRKRKRNVIKWKRNVRKKM